MDLSRDGRLVAVQFSLWNRRRKLHGDQIFLSKSGAGGNKPQETAAEKACADQNYERDGNFAYHQEAAKALAGGRARVGARASAQGLVQISPGSAPRGKEPERNGNRYNRRQRKQQNRRVNGDTLLPREVRRKNCGDYLHCPNRN